MSDSLSKKISFLLLGLFCVGFLVILWNFWGRLSFPEDYRMFRDDGKENLNPGEPIAEKFMSSQSNLAQVNILLGNLENIFPSEKLIVSILDENCQATLRETSHAWPSHAPKQFDRFSFDPIPDSQGKTYCLSILFDAHEMRKSRPYVVKMKQTGNVSDSFMNLATGKVTEEQTLLFRPAYREDSPKATLAELIRRMSAYKAEYLQGTLLLTLVLLFLGSTFFLSFWLLLRQEKDE
jgi:hypothetical protein